MHIKQDSIGMWQGSWRQETHNTRRMRTTLHLNCGSLFRLYNLTKMFRTKIPRLEKSIEVSNKLFDPWNKRVQSKLQYRRSSMLICSSISILLISLSPALLYYKRNPLLSVRMGRNITNLKTPTLTMSFTATDTCLINV